MSGIVGLFHLDARPIDGNDLARMTDILVHRGPDGADLWCNDSVGLGHRMLHTTPESLYEKLPFVKVSDGNVQDDLVITADARIDNRDELIPQLGLDDRPSIEVADSQVILAAYEKWGTDCPDKLLGDFAFVIWDNRKRQLFCARDHFGIKPFYYYVDEHFFAFASEIKALLVLPQVSREVNEVWFADYLAEIFSDKQATAYRDIFRLPPAHTLSVHCQGSDLHNYWALNPSHELQLGSNEAYAEAFHAIFTEAVRCRLRSQLPVGSMLSGGLDSSSIACVGQSLLEKEGKPKLRTFSAVFDELPECDERPYIEAVLAQGKFSPFFLRGDKLNPIAEIDQILEHQDQPFHAPGHYLRWNLLAMVKKQGVRVLFDGYDGDSTVSHGFGYLRELARDGRWIALAQHMPRVSAAYSMAPQALFWDYFWTFKLGPILSRSSIFVLLHRIGRRAIRAFSTEKKSISPSASRTKFLNPNFVQRTSLLERVKEEMSAESARLPSERDEHFRSLTHGRQVLGAELLDKMGAAFSVEMRYPFWDKRLVEFCLSLPPQQKIDKGWSRIVLRRAMSGVLPSVVQWRVDKSNLLSNLVRGLVTFGRELVNNSVSGLAGEVEGYVNVSAVRTAYNRFLSSKSYQDGQELYMILRVILLAKWSGYIRSR